MKPELRVHWRARPRDRFLRGSALVLGVLAVAAWLLGDFDLGETFNARRADNLVRFFGQIRPFPLQGRPWDWGIAWDWAAAIMRDRGFDAAVATVSIAVLATAIAASLGGLSSLLAARTLAVAEPFLTAGQPPAPAVRLVWRVLGIATRASLVIARALPEYLLAFLLLAIFGSSAWPIVLALAIHNAGILGRLYAESIENLDPRVPRALRGVGASRLAIATIGIGPAVFSRALLYAFYRWETCVREATVLGMLGVVSLGYWIQDARVRGQDDVFVLLIGIGVVIVLAGDLLSAWVRRVVR